MTEHDDPVDAVILAYLEYLEGTGEQPSLDGLGPGDRARAQAYLEGLAVARGLDPYAVRPSVEALLVGTPLAPLLPTLGQGGKADLTAVRAVLAKVDPRATAEIDVEGSQVVYTYLDLRARFLLVEGAAPTVTGDVRAAVEARFGADPDMSWVGVVAGGSGDLITQMLAADEIASAITTPRGEPHLRWEQPLPLALAARRMLERGAPEWPVFDFDPTRGEALDVAGVAADIARRIIARESGRPYRGEKRKAYRALAGHEHHFAELVARIADPTATLDLEAEIGRIARAAA